MILVNRQIPVCRAEKYIIIFMKCDTMRMLVDRTILRELDGDEKYARNIAVLWNQSNYVL